MSDQRDGGISWCDETWNPIRGCSRVSPGCKHCYAETMASRFAGPGMPYEGLARNGRWTGKVRMVPEHLPDPLRWKRPRRIFVNSMSDLFHEALTNEEIAAVFGVMAAAPQHTFQVLTKRAERMREWFGAGPTVRSTLDAALDAMMPDDQRIFRPRLGYQIGHRPWPLPNVWLGVSVEDQQRAEERIPALLETPAAVRFLSVEPQLGPVNLEDFIPDPLDSGPHTFDPMFPCRCGLPSVDWVIVGGESGFGARPFHLEWARSLVRQCRASGVPVWVKQLGSCPLNEAEDPVRFVDRKGASKSEWPEDLRVRQWPTQEEAAKTAGGERR